MFCDISHKANAVEAQRSCKWSCKWRYSYSYLEVEDTRCLAKGFVQIPCAEIYKFTKKESAPAYRAFAAVLVSQLVDLVTRQTSVPPADAEVEAMSCEYCP